MITLNGLADEPGTFNFRACPVWAIPAIGRMTRIPGVEPLSFSWTPGIGFGYLTYLLHGEDVTLQRATLDKDKMNEDYLPTVEFLGMWKE